MSISASHRVTLDMKTFEQIAIERLQEYEPAGKAYKLGFSGGKDSGVVMHIAERADVAFEAHFSQTTIDPPEVVRFIRDNYPAVIWKKPRRNMFKIIEEKKALPTRMMRFCCRELKEMGQRGDVVITGLRWEESAKRRLRLPYEESTLKKGLFFVNPIIEWTTEEVWAYIRKYRLPYCSLYDEGYDRIGCIMCPLQGEKGMRKDMERFPAVYRRYMKAIRRVLNNGPSPFWEGKTAEQVMEWWITGKWPDKVS